MLHFVSTIGKLLRLEGRLELCRTDEGLKWRSILKTTKSPGIVGLRSATMLRTNFPAGKRNGTHAIAFMHLQLLGAPRGNEKGERISNVAPVESPTLAFKYLIQIQVFAQSAAVWPLYQRERSVHHAVRITRRTSPTHPSAQGLAYQKEIEKDCGDVVGQYGL